MTKSTTNAMTTETLTIGALTIDIGNSALKWGEWQQGQLVVANFCDYQSGDLGEVLEAQLAALDRSENIWVACVAGAAVENELIDWLHQNWKVVPHFLRTTAELAGVTNIYADPSEHGVDRWAALLGAKRLYQAPVCVIDAGTAVTVDLMDAQGMHRGGRIMPGLDMMRHSLLQQTAGISQVEGDSPGFAINTADAVTSGTLHMLSAGLDEVSVSAKKHLGDDMKTIITGGSAEQMLPLLNISELHHEPNLILHGLYLASSQSGSVRQLGDKPLADMQQMGE